MSLSKIPTKDLYIELINRDKADTDNEGQFVIYTGLYDVDSE
jgi:hypothetical protein